MSACVSQLLRAGFVAVAAPLLFTGTIFDQISHQLQLNGFRNAEYAATEYASSTALDRQAKQSTATAEEDQAVVGELETDATRHGEQVGADEVVAGEQIGVAGENEVASAGEAGTAAVVQEVPGVNVAADVTEGSAIAGQQVTAIGAAFNAIKNEAYALEEGGQATADTNLALEKEAESESLTAAATVEEGASIAAKRQAAKSGVLAGGLYAEAFFCQLVSAVFQLPVVLLLFTKWAVAATAGSCDACIGASLTSSALATKGAALLPASWIVSRLSLAATVSSLVAVPWASTVLAASGETGLMSEAKAVTGIANSHRLLEAVHGKSKKHHVAEPGFLNGLNPFAKPNIATTTFVPPKHAPPARESHWDMVAASINSIFEHLVHWARPVLMDIGLISVAFAAAGFAFGTGKHVPKVKQGSLSHRAAAGNILREVLDHWLWGFALLIAIWVFSIMMAKECQPIAKHVQHASVGILVCGSLAFLCLVAYTLHGWTLAQVQSVSPASVPEASGESKRLLASESSDRSSQFSGSRETEQGIRDIEAPSDDVAADHLVNACCATACVCGMVGAAFEFVLQAAERPINAWAMGGSYKTVVMCWSLFSVLSWNTLAKSFAANWLHLLIAIVMLILALFGVCRLLRHVKRESDGEYADEAVGE